MFKRSASPAPAPAPDASVPARRARSRRHPLNWCLSLWFWLFLVLACSVAGLAVSAFVTLLAEESSLSELEHYDPPQVSRVLEGDGKQVLATFYGMNAEDPKRIQENREIIPQAEMPRILKDAFLAAEDERFYQHFGLDFRGLARAMFTNLQRGAMRQGASTISQQLARNVSPRIGRERSLRRKVLEAFYAFLIEQRYSKDQILEFYLNQIALGHNAFGVQSAAKTYFGKGVKDGLTVAECAALASIPQAPTKVNPISGPDRVLKRRNLIIDNMQRLGMIDATTATLSKAEAVLTSRTAQPRISSPYFIDQVRRSLADNPEFEEDLLQRGGFQIYSTENSAFQKIVEEEVSKGLPFVEKEWQQGKQARFERERRQFVRQWGDTALRAGQHRLARILAVNEDGVQVEVEGRRGFAAFRREPDASGKPGPPVKPWFFPEEVLVPGRLIDVAVREVSKTDRTIDLALYDTTHVQGAAVLLDAASGRILALTGGADYYDQNNNGMWNRAIHDPGRQPGSAFKPLLYGLALDRGRTPGTVIVDERTAFGKYVPRNFENMYFGPTTLVQALAHSNNVVTVKLFHALGYKAAIEGYYKYDILKPGRSWKIPSELPVCLGSISVTPLALAASYLPFVRSGIIAEPCCIDRVEDLQGNVVKTIRPRERYVLSAQSAYQTARMMVEVVRNGTGKGAIGKYFDWKKTPEMGGKTGTTTDCVDAWFAGFTPELVLVVWVGFDQVRSLGNSMTGARAAAPIWRSIMERLLATRADWKMKFDVPDDLIFLDISAANGLRAVAGTDEQIVLGIPFVRKTAPSAYSSGGTARAGEELEWDETNRNPLGDAEDSGEEPAALGEPAATDAGPAPALESAAGAALSAPGTVLSSPGASPDPTPPPPAEDLLQPPQ